MLREQIAEPGAEAPRALLDEYPPPDPRGAEAPEQPLAGQWSIWGLTEIEPSLLDILLNRMVLPEDQRNEAAAEAAEKALDRPMKVLDDTLDDRAHLLGGDFTITGLNVAAVLTMAKMVRYDTSGYANAHRWFEACTGRESFARARQL